MVSRASQDIVLSDRDYWNKHPFPARWTVDISHDASSSLKRAERGRARFCQDHDQDQDLNPV
jgi:hypothetical protein